MLAFVQLVHLLDTFRYARNAEFPSSLADPAALFGITAAMVAFLAVWKREPIARLLAIAASAGVAAGFVLYHGIPIKLRNNNPYWGPDGHADLIRWLTVLAAIGVAIWTLRLARRLPRNQLASVPSP